MIYEGRKRLTTYRCIQGPGHRAVLRRYLLSKLSKEKNVSWQTWYESNDTEVRKNRNIVETS
jgi:hypothetical protein